VEHFVPEGNGVIDKSQARIARGTYDHDGGCVLRWRAKLSVNRVAAKIDEEQEQADGAFHS
jgi:hypothetical protein